MREFFRPCLLYLIRECLFSIACVFLAAQVWEKSYRLIAHHQLSTVSLATLDSHITCYDCDQQVKLRCLITQTIACVRLFRSCLLMDHFLSWTLTQFIFPCGKITWRIYFKTTCDFVFCFSTSYVCVKFSVTTHRNTDIRTKMQLVVLVSFLCIASTLLTVESKPNCTAKGIRKYA